MEKIEPLKVYPQPPFKGCRPCYEDNPNYAREAQAAADEAKTASVVAENYAKEIEGSLDDYYDKEETDALLAAKADTSDLNDYYDKTEVDTLLDDKQDIDSMNAYYTKTAADALLAGKKDLQTAKTSPTASSTTNAFIDTITQNEQGVITATKKTVRSASASQSGLMNSTMYTKLNNLPADVYSKTETDTLLSGKVDKSDLDYTTTFPTLSHGNNYASYGNTYYIVQGKHVHVHVGVSGLTANQAVTLFQLPEGVRPPTHIYGYGFGDTRIQICAIDIYDTGYVVVVSTGTYAGCDISFEAITI